jgi:hypothetical protein
MIEYDLYEKDEIIRPRTIVKKPKTKKSNHKHDYKFEIRQSTWSNAFIKVEVCSICQREGDHKIIRKGEEDE